MNLHGWITEQVERIESEHRSVVVIPANGGTPIVGKITDAVHTDDGIEFTVTPGPPVAAAVIRRCEADRRILARHNLPEPGHWMHPACAGCGTYGDLDTPTTENINDCPELLDLAHAHGITPDQLAALNRIEPVGVVPVVPFTRRPIKPTMTTDQVPPALRGRHWHHRH